MPMPVAIPRLSLVPVFLREVFGTRTLPREPEPDLVMDDADQVRAYSDAGRIDGVMAASYLFQSARISQVVQGCKRVLDLGCGPATQLAQVAELNPAVEFLGADLSAEMLQSARGHVSQLGLSNVSFVQDDITRLEHVPDQSVDGVMSTVTLHHLPTHEQLRSCFRQIRRVLQPGGAVYLIDFGRLKSLQSVLFFAYMNRDNQPHLFSLDYERSLRAAFLYEDFAALARAELPPDVAIYSTFKMPFLTLLKTADRPLPNDLGTRLRQMRRALPARYRHDLDDMRLFFRLGGLANDPF